MKKELEKLFNNLVTPPFAEEREVDYKQAMHWDTKLDKKGCERISKGIIAMANSGGGYIVIGIKEENGILKQDPLSVEQLSSWESTKLSTFVNNIITPSNLKLKLYTYPYNKPEYVIIKIDSFEVQPFLVKQANSCMEPHHVYCRNDNKESAPISSPEGWSELFEKTFKAKSELVVTQMREVLNPSIAALEVKTDYNTEADNLYEEHILTHRNKLSKETVKEPGFKSLICIPENYKEINFDWEELESAIKSASLSFEDELDWPLIHYCTEKKFETWTPEDYPEGLYATKEMVGFLGPRYNHWNVQKNGILLYDSFLEEDVYTYGHNEASKIATNTKVFDPELEYVQLAKLIYSVGKYYESLGFEHSEKLYTKIIYFNMKDREIGFPSRYSKGGDMYAYPSKKRKDNIYENQRLIELSSFLSNTDLVIQELIFSLINLFKYGGAALNRTRLSSIALKTIEKPRPFSEWRFLY